MPDEPSSSSGSKRKIEDNAEGTQDKKNRAQPAQGEKRPLGGEVQSPMSDVQEERTIPVGIWMELNSLVTKDHRIHRR